MAKKKEQQSAPKKQIETVARNGKCLTCGSPMVKNHLSCVRCRRKKRLMAKANRRGKPKNYYINGGM